MTAEQRHDNANDCLLPPIITSFNPDNGTTSGGVLTSFFGDNFGDVNSTIVISMNTVPWQSIIRQNETWITAKSPAGTGKTIPITITVDGIPSTTNNMFFNYNKPNITSITSPPFKGGTVQIQGNNFGSIKEKVTVEIDEDGCSSKPCENVQIAVGGIQCLYNQQGTFGSCRGVVVTVDSQVSSRVEYCYDVDKGEITGLPVGIQQVTEAKNLTYDISLSVVPTANVQINLTAIPNNAKYNCILEPTTLLFPPSSAITVTEAI
jgi:hypothetical protein